MLDENDVIDLITRRFGRLPKGYLPIGDDVGAIPPGGPGRRVVLKCDMLVGRTDVPTGMTWAMAARKAVAMCVSDFAAKGVRPTAFMVSLGLPRGTTKEKVEEIASGLVEGSREWGLSMVGGDTGEADDLVIDCMMVGFAKEVVTRGGARPGELVVVTGTFGQTAAGLKIVGGAKAEPRFRDVAVSSVYRPTPNLELGIALSSYLSSSTDSSDGLAISLHSISEMSGVGMRLGRLPYVDGLEEFASLNSFSAEELALYGGEEYGIVGTIPEGRFQAARRKALSVGSTLTAIGETMPGGRSRTVVLSDGRRVRRDGWVHFKSRRRPSRP